MRADFYYPYLHRAAKVVHVPSFPQDIRYCPGHCMDFAFIISLFFCQIYTFQRDFHRLPAACYVFYPWFLCGFLGRQSAISPFSYCSFWGHVSTATFYRYGFYTPGVVYTTAHIQPAVVIGWFLYALFSCRTLFY